MLDLGLGLGDSRCVAGLASPFELLLGLGQAFAQGARNGLVSTRAAPPAGIGGFSYPLLGGAHLVIDAPHGVARDVADGVESSWISRSAAWAALTSLRSIAAASAIERLFDLLIRHLLGVALGEDARTAGEEAVLGGPETGPQRVLDVLGRARCGLPLGHQVLHRRGRLFPVRGLGQLLGPADQLFLGRLGGAPLGVERGEVRPPPATELVAGGGEPLPQRVVGLAVDALDQLPFVDDRAQPVARCLPRGGALGDLLGLDGQGLLGRGRLGSGLSAGGAGRSAFSWAAASSASIRAPRAVEITDGGGVRAAAPSGRAPECGWRRVAGAGGEPVLEQRHLGRKIVEAADVIGQARFGVAGLP